MCGQDKMFLYVVCHEMISQVSTREQQARKRRPTLIELRPNYSSVNGDFEHWSAGERHREPGERVIVPKQRDGLCLYSSEGQEPGLLELLEHAQTKEQGGGDE